MPLKVNVPPGRKDWKLTKCPECGAQCWELPLAEVAKAQGAKGLCTMCALKNGRSDDGAETIDNRGIEENGRTASVVSG